MHKNITKYFFIGFLFYGAAAFQASAKESAEIVFSMSVPRPGCSVSVESSRNLGELKPGKQEHPDIPVTIACSGTVKTALIAEPVDRRKLLTDNTTLFVPIEGEEGPHLRLVDDNGLAIKLTGMKSDAFCTNTGEGQTCHVTPLTNVRKGTPVGKGSVAIRFNVVYL